MSEAVKFLPQIKAAFKYVLPIAVAMNETHPYEEQDITYPNLCFRFRQLWICRIFSFWFRIFRQVFDKCWCRCC
jgi:hypothetical protein